MLQVNAKLDMELQSRHWYARVPSKSNISDAASRLSFDDYSDFTICFNRYMISAIRHLNILSRLKLCCWKRGGRKATKMFVQCLALCGDIHGVRNVVESTLLGTSPFLTIKQKEKEIYIKCASSVSFEFDKLNFGSCFFVLRRRGSRFFFVM